MNETTHKTLMVEVERAVRPVRASQARKLRMREELLAHLTAIYEEEAAQRGDEQAALSQAKQRFGNPRELAEELQQTVPFLNRTCCLLEIANFRASDSLKQLTIKYLLLTSSAIAIGLLLFVFIFLMQGKYNAIYYAFWIVVAIISKTFALIMGIMMLGVIFMDRLRKTFFSRTSRFFGARVTMDILISFCVFPLLAFIHYLAQTGDLAGSLKYLIAGCVFAPLAPIMFILLARLYDREIRAQEKWTNLEIDA